MRTTYTFDVSKHRTSRLNHPQKRRMNSPAAEHHLERGKIMATFILFATHTHI
jgi:hypothetical protein